MSEIYVGGRPKLGSTVLLAEYDPEWPALFAAEEARIRGLLGSAVVSLDHVGSTSVSGLAAKPIIDMLLVVSDADDEASYVAPLEAAGYRLTIREPDWHGHRLLKGPDTNINLHVFPRGCAQIRRHLEFRDWLRTHDDDRELYERTKRELAAREWEYIQDYANAKNAVVMDIQRRIVAARVRPEPEVEYVQERGVLNAPVRLVDYDPRWPALFAVEEARIRAALGSDVRVEHVGSTSVPGLAAKPLIDILLVVPDVADEASYVPALVAQGYALRLREPGHRLLKGPEVDVNLHVYSPGDEEIDRILSFRDWLRTNDGDRALYERTKRELAAREWEHVQDYADAKTRVVEQIILNALAA